MNKRIGEVIYTLRTAAGLNQTELAEKIGVRQPTIARYENGTRAVEEDVLAALALAFEVTPEFLTHQFRLRAGVAVDAHMRRRKTTSPTDWKRVEARLNVHRMQSAYLFSRAPLSPQEQVISVDPAEVPPEDAARMQRNSWKMPIGPVRNLAQWVEAAGVVIFEEDFGTNRIDGMSQWVDGTAVMLINANFPTDRKRMTIAHELGHLVMHNEFIDGDVEAEANAFAAEFLMPEAFLRHALRERSLSRLRDLKLEWGVSLQALFERAHNFGLVSGEERQRFYRSLNARGWKTREPDSELISPEIPRLVTSFDEQLRDAGLTQEQIQELRGQKRKRRANSTADRHLRIVS